MERVVLFDTYGFLLCVLLTKMLQFFAGLSSFADVLFTELICAMIRYIHHS